MPTYMGQAYGRMHGVLVEQACSRATDKHDSNLRTGWVSMPTDPATMPRGEVPVGYACPHIRQACQVVECWRGKHAHRLGKHARWWSAGGVSMPTDPATMPRGEVPVGYACPHIRQACQVVECWRGKHAHRLGKHARWWSAGRVSMPTD